jgi:hypothetical protein
MAFVGSAATMLMAFTRAQALRTLRFVRASLIILLMALIIYLAALSTRSHL